jgi:hypothetical protein
MRDREVVRSLRRLAAVTGWTGGPLLLLGVILHPAREAAGIRAAGQVYGLTHGLQVLSLMLIAVCLVAASSQLRERPDVVHTPADLEPGVAMVALPALVIEPR